MQHQRAVGVDHALRLSRGAGGVAHRRRGVFVQQVRKRLGLARGQQRVVVERAGGCCAILRDHDDMLERRTCGEFLECGPEHVVHDGDAVACIAGDEGEIIRVEPKVQRVEHQARRGRAEVCFEVPVMVPGERGDAIAGPHAKSAERCRQSPCLLEALAIGVPVQRSIGTPADDLARRVQALGVAQEGGERQRRVHHEATQCRLRIGVGDCASARTACK